MHASPASPDVRKTVVGGIPAYFTPATQGALTVALAFRAGQADETLAQSGLTHVVEHLAMHDLGRPAYPHNAFVEDTRTVFWATGTRAEVAEFLLQITRSLAQLPTDRFELERELLTAESARRGRSGVSELFRITRYGAGPYGLPTLEEYGLRRASTDDILGWAQRYFRPENAVLYVDGFEPTELEIALVPGGSRVAVPIPDPPYVPLPGWDMAAVNGGGFSLQCDRSSAFSAAQVMLMERLQERLRHELALCYSVEANRTLMGRQQHVETWLSPIPDRVGDAIHEALALINDVAYDGFSAEEVRRWKEQSARAIAEAPGPMAMAMLDVLSYQELIGAPTSVAELEQERAAVTPASATDAYRSGLGSFLALVPGGIEVCEEGLTRAPQYSTQRLPSTKTRKHRPKAPYEQLQHRLESSPAGLTLSFTKADQVVVPFQSATVLAWESGQRQVIGRDGFRITVDPVLWSRGEELLRLIDGAVAEPDVVPMDRVEREKPTRQISLPTKIVLTVLLWLMAVASLWGFVAAQSDPQNPPAPSPASGEPTEPTDLFPLFLITSTISVVLTVSVRRDLRDRRLRKRLS